MKQTPPLIILAGGRSSRMGTPKGLIKINDLSLFEHQIKFFSMHGGTEVIIVLGHIKDEYLDLLNNIIPKYPEIAINVVINQNPDRGQFSSLQEALITHKDFMAGFFILPIDTPMPYTNIISQIINNIDEQIDVIIPRFNSNGGHPIWISNNMAQTIITSCDDDRLDHLIKNLSKDRILNIELLDPSVTYNINTPEDLQILK